MERIDHLDLLARLPRDLAETAKDAVETLAQILPPMAGHQDQAAIHLGQTKLRERALAYPFNHRAQRIDHRVADQLDPPSGDSLASEILTSRRGWRQMEIGEVAQ